MTNDLVLFSSQDPKALVSWLCQTYGLQAILQAIAEYRPTSTMAEAAPTKRAYKKRAKKGATKKAAGKRGRKKGSRNKPKTEGENS